MPELPEVETIARILRLGTQEQPALIGRQILEARMLWERTLVEPSPPEFSSRLVGQVIAGIGRRGKFLYFQLSGGWLLFHLRMSGDLCVRPAGSPTETHDRLLMMLEGDIQLAFNDTRKFGRVWLVEEFDRVVGDLGPEPLDGALTAGVFYSCLHATHRQLKPLLLDQGFLAGLGNIYTDEALHLARLHPLTPANILSEDQAARLLDAIRTVLREGIARNGASIDWVYRRGEFQNYFRVYQRTGEPCPECGTLIARISVGQRGTHFCPQCQTAYFLDGG
jgi:formamidopyrimidine-DNA glycosylase